jgi:hypothetical protein
MVAGALFELPPTQSQHVLSFDFFFLLKLLTFFPHLLLSSGYGAECSEFMKGTALPGVSIVLALIMRYPSRLFSPSIFSLEII